MGEHEFVEMPGHPRTCWACAQEQPQADPAPGAPVLDVRGGVEVIDPGDFEQLNDYVQRVRHATRDEVERVIDEHKSVNWTHYHEAGIRATEWIRHRGWAPARVEWQRRADNALTAAWGAAEIPPTGAYSLQPLWAANGIAIQAFLGRAALSPDEYALLIQPMSKLLPDAFREPDGIGTSLKEALSMPEVEPFTKEKQTRKPGRPRTEPAATSKPGRRGSRSAPIPLTQEMTDAKRASATAEAPKAASKPAKRTEKPQAAAPGRRGRPTGPEPTYTGVVATVVKQATEFCQRHEATFERFRTEKMGYVGGAFAYACAQITKELPSLRGDARLKVAFAAMAEMAKNGDPKLKRLATAWAWWEPLATMAESEVRRGLVAAKSDSDVSMNEPVDEAPVSVHSGAELEVVEKD